MQVFVSVLTLTVMPKTSSGNALHILVVSKERDVIEPFNTLDIWTEYVHHLNAKMQQHMVKLYSFAAYSRRAPV